MLVQVSQDMGTEAPIPISTKLGDLNNLFRKIVSAAEHPHLSIPETEAGRSRKQYHRLINRSLMVVSGMTTFCISIVHLYGSCHFLYLLMTCGPHGTPCP